MLYIEFVEYRNKYYEAQKVYESIVNENQELFSMTQPRATTFDNEKVTGGKEADSFNTYIIKKDERNITERLKEAKTILEARKMLVEMKEKELRTSSDKKDQIYVYRYLEKKKIKQIRNLVHYEEAQIFRILREIKENLKRRL